ncbi:MAG: tetratricopeptide repeat protein, partial [Pirellulaceae bacterium]
MADHFLLPRGVLALVVLTQAGCHLPFQKDASPAARPVVGAHVAPPFQETELSPKQAAQACITTAEKLEAAGHRREAIGLYQRARQHRPQAIDYSRRLAVLYDQEGDSANALREYGEAIAADPNNADLANDFGYFHFIQGDLASAEASFRKALTLDQNHPRAWTNLGLVLA